MTSKNCTKCSNLKPLFEFGKRKHGLNGLNSACKECSREKYISQRRTRIGKLTSIYHSQIKSSIKRGYKLPNYSITQFQEWALSSKKYNELYDNWVKSKYEKKLAPSPDRIDDYKPYTFDNLQWMTWGNNDNKGKHDMKNGINRKRLKAVVQLTLSGDFVAKFYSAIQAGRETGFKHIGCCCNGIRKTAGGFKWEYQ